MPIHTTDHGWVLETRTTAYVIGLNEAGLLTHRYWGIRLPHARDYPAAANPEGWAAFNNPAHLTPEEYPGYEDMKFTEPCLKVAFADGVRDVVLRYTGADICESTTPELRISLRDTVYPLNLTLHYRVHATYDLIERWVSVTNEGAEPITIERIWSALWHLPLGDVYRLTHLSGRWTDEMHLQRELLTPGLKVLESRRITTSHHYNPWFAIDRGNADEELGDVWFGALAWSGNWKILAEMTDVVSTQIGIGINDWDGAWRLIAGETFTTPGSYAGYTLAGFGAASRHMHDYIRDHLLPHGKVTHKVLYNSWEDTTFQVDEASQCALAESAAAMGVELFVMDDGWFHRRDDDNAGLGDWWPDERKFPHGLSGLIERVNELGMDFGLWIEPEMVNPDSDLYWALQIGLFIFLRVPRTLAVINSS
ncbi:MAG: alpha-galactosidase [Chloroflexi bacterium AL-W]|nr:alpha-galactosidase [Chloroflexi bacterium AL-N1]NOK65353.1 alpha-galactosidase [Chloroflexi bacterium AL-N10]NOK72381.1 alpha-galactosidase [Chloroflexi bacterium AL-N5]NOK79532.1 alpha-galactosidase [Chloroflexi bacterium AL-W]NOK87448.1 alpha-galactosidase [Chloroflexi bacterium AL-N15]